MYTCIISALQLEPVSRSIWCLTFTETTRFIRDEEKGERSMGVGKEGDYIPRGTEVSFCCLTSTEARKPIRNGDEWENGDRRVKRRNGPQSGRPRLPWTAARTTEC